MNMPLDTIHIILYVLIAIVIILLSVLVRLEIRIRHLMRGKNSHSLEDSFNSMRVDIDELHRFRNELESYLTLVEKRVRRSIQSIETIRFNPFKGTGSGGDQSFATALMDENGNGVVLSSLYSRDHVSVFSKPLSSHSSPYELTDEERDVIARAQKNVASIQ